MKSPPPCRRVPPLWQAFDEPQTAEWYRRMEAEFPGGLKAFECILGLLVALDTKNLVEGDERRKFFPGYCIPEAYSLKDRQFSTE